MKAIRIHAYGNSDQLQMEEAPQPQPKPGEVVVQVYRAGVNPVDWKIRAGARRETQPDAFPLTMGQDFAGEIAEPGGAATGFRVGERVFGFASGAYAEYVTAAATDLARMPEAMSFETAASLPTPGVTAYQVVTRAAELKAGQSVLIHGGAGAVGAIAVQLARLRGAQVAATAVNDHDIAYLKELGVSPAINSHTERFEDRVRDLDAVIDLVGGELQRRSYALIKPGGVIVTTVGGLNADEAEHRGIRAVSFRMTRDGADLAELAKLVERGQLRIRAARVLPFEQAREAQEISQRGDATGKVVLRVA